MTETRTATAWSAPIVRWDETTVTTKVPPPEPGVVLNTREMFEALFNFFSASAALTRWQEGRVDNDPPYRQAEAEALFKARRDTMAEVYRIYGEQQRRLIAPPAASPE